MPESIKRALAAYLDCEESDLVEYKSIISGTLQFAHYKDGDLKDIYLLDRLTSKNYHVYRQLSQLEIE